MRHLNFPLTLTFKFSTFANDFVVKDAAMQTVFYVRQKMFKLTEDVRVYTDESQTAEIYRIAANKWLDFSATYSFTNANGEPVGSVARKGWASIWQARYEIYDQNRQQDLLISEENPWVKVADALLGEIPILNFFTGYFFNPTYAVTDTKGYLIARLRKQHSFLERRFVFEKVSQFESETEAERTVLGVMMMILLEKNRG